jgi:hypothetical protein
LPTTQQQSQRSALVAATRAIFRIGPNLQRERFLFSTMKTMCGVRSPSRANHHVAPNVSLSEPTQQVIDHVHNVTSPVVMTAIHHVTSRVEFLVQVDHNLFAA